MCVKGMVHPEIKILKNNLLILMVSQNLYHLLPLRNTHKHNNMFFFCPFYESRKKIFDVGSQTVLVTSDLTTEQKNKQIINKLKFCHYLLTVCMTFCLPLNTHTEKSIYFEQYLNCFCSSQCISKQHCKKIL